MAARSTLRRWALPALGATIVALGLTASGSAAAPAPVAAPAPAAAPAATPAVPGWGPAASATIHPGIFTDTQGGHCTANFVYTDARGEVYLGQAAHCSGTGGATETDGCRAASLPLGTRVVLGDSGVTGTLAYNSWITMQRRGERNPDACTHNDLALVKIPAGAVGRVNPSVPVWGGPVGLDTDGTQRAEPVLSYGNSSLRGGMLSAKRGHSLGSVDHGWSHPVYTDSPGVPGDSGSAFLDGQGRAIGTLSTLAVAPLPLSNEVSDLAHELRYAQRHSGIPGLRLERGTEQFRGPASP
jgi:hypothetical protein